MTENEISNIVIGGAIKIHKSLGPGLLESAYQKCLAFELRERGLYVQKEVPPPAVYKSMLGFYPSAYLCLVRRLRLCPTAVRYSFGRHAVRQSRVLGIVSNRLENRFPTCSKEIKLNHGYRIGLLINKKIIIEIKTLEEFTDVHIARVLTYLKLSKLHLGLLINFHVTMLKNGNKGFVL